MDMEITQANMLILQKVLQKMAMTLLVQTKKALVKVKAKEGFQIQKNFKFKITQSNYFSLIKFNFRFIEQIDKKYGGRNVDKFLLGNSVGGLLSLKMTLKKDNYFKGLGLLAPLLNVHH